MRHYIAMLSRFFTPFLLIIIQTFSLIHSSIIPPPRPFNNLSHFLFPRVTAITELQLTPQPPHFLQGVLDAIVNKEKWALEDIQVSELNVKKARYGAAQRYEIHVPVGKSEIVLKMYEQPSEWKKLMTIKKNGSSNFESSVRKIGSKALIESFKIEGPFELQVTGDDDQLSIMLPSNTSHTGLRRISVGEGITVEVKGAEEISMFHYFNRRQPPYGYFTYGKMNVVGSISPDTCTALPTIRILGSASVIAHFNQRPSAFIKTVFSSGDAIELLPEKCYIWPNYKKPRHLFSTLSSRIAFLEQVLRSFLNEKAKPSSSVGSLRARIRASTIFRFYLELVRDIKSNDPFWSTLAEWRTRPTVEHVRFEVAAKIEGEILKPLVIKKVRPFVDTDSFAWSSLLSNVSFTKFPSVFVPPEALTLDVKW